MREVRSGEPSSSILLPLGEGSFYLSAPRGASREVVFVYLRARASREAIPIKQSNKSLYQRERDLG